MKVTTVSAQTGFSDAAIVMLTGKSGFTVMVTVLEVAGFPEGQIALEVKTQVTASRFNGVKE